MYNRIAIVVTAPMSCTKFVTTDWLMKIDSRQTSCNLTRVLLYLYSHVSFMVKKTIKLLKIGTWPRMAFITAKFLHAESMWPMGVFKTRSGA